MILEISNKLIIKIFLLKTFLVFSLSANDYMDNCTVPNVLLKTVQITENETSNPYLIRTNQDINSFYNIINVDI